MKALFGARSRQVRVHHCKSFLDESPAGGAINRDSKVAVMAR
jgi:hypothetical protein